MRIEEQAEQVLELTATALRALPSPAAQRLAAKLDRPPSALLAMVQQALVATYQGQITVPLVWRQILGVSPSRISPQPLGRSVDRVAVAQACRTLFKGIGLSSVRFRKYVSTHTEMVEVEVPEAHVPEPLSQWVFDHDERSGGPGALGPVRSMRSAVSAHLEGLLDHAFPQLKDRSDSRTDYFDAVFSIHVRDVPTAWDPAGLPGLLPLVAEPPIEHQADDARPSDEQDGGEPDGGEQQDGEQDGGDEQDGDEEEVADLVPPPQGPADPAEYLAWLGIRVEATTTHPSRPGKAPRPVWNLKGNTAPYEPIIVELGGNRWNAAWSFWEDPVGALAERIRVQGALTFAAQQERQRQRAADRAERLTGRAQKHATEGQRRIDAAHKIAGMIPFGQPIHRGHHSEGRHLGDLKRIANHERKGWGELKYAEKLEGRAEHNETIASGDRGLPFLSDRLAEAVAELRRIERSLAGRLVYVEGKPRLQAPQGEDKTALLREEQQAQEKVVYWKAEITKAGGIPYGRHNVAAGDLVEHRGQWFPVVKVNEKTVRVSHWLNIAGVKSNVDWSQITGARRPDGEQGESAPTPPPVPLLQLVKDQPAQAPSAAEPPQGPVDTQEDEPADAEEDEQDEQDERQDLHIEVTKNGREIPCRSMKAAFVLGGQDSYEIRVNGEMVLSAIRDFKNSRWITEVYAPLPFTSQVPIGPQELPSGAEVRLDSWKWATPIRPTQWMELPFGVGVRLDAKFAAGSFDDLPAYVAACRGSTTKWTSSVCQVEKVVLLSPSAYDQYTAVGGDLKRQCPYLGAGGTRSDFSEAPFDPDGPPEERFPWLAESYRMVTVFAAPDRAPFVVDPQGQPFAAAVGVEPSYDHHRAPVVRGQPLRVGPLPTTPIDGVGVPLAWRKIAEVQLVPVIEFDKGGGGRTHLAAEARRLFKELGIPDVRVRVKGTIDVFIPRVLFATPAAEQEWDDNRDHQNLGREVERRLSRIIHLAFPGHGNVRHSDPNSDYPYLILIWMVDLHDEPGAKLDTGLISPAALEAPLYPAEKRPAGAEPAPPPKPAPPAAHIPQLTLQGSTFTLTRSQEPDKRGNPIYFLNGSRSAKYMVAAVGPITKRDGTRDERKHLYYLWNAGKGLHLPKHLERVWLTDEGGQLREYEGRRTKPDGVPIESIPIDGEPPPVAPAAQAAAIGAAPPAAPPGPRIVVEDRSAAGDLAMDAAAAAQGIPRAELSSQIEQTLEGRQIGWAGVPNISGAAPLAPAPAAAVVLQALTPLVKVGRVLDFDGAEYQVKDSRGKVLFSSPDPARVVQMSHIKEVPGGTIPKPIATALKSWQLTVAAATAAPALSAVPSGLAPQGQATPAIAGKYGRWTPIRVERSHVGQSRMMAEFSDPIGHIPRQRDIPSPYASGPDHPVWRYRGKNVFVVETAHKVYGLFEVPDDIPISSTTPEDLDEQEPPTAPAPDSRNPDLRNPAAPAPSCPRPALSDKGRQDRIDRLRALAGALEGQAQALHQGIMSAYDSSNDRRVTARRAEQLAGADDNASQKIQVQLALGALADALAQNCDGLVESELDQAVKRCLPQSLMGVAAMPPGQIRPLIEDLLYKKGWPVPQLHQAHLKELIEASAERPDLAGLRLVAESIRATGCTRYSGDVCPVSDPTTIEQLMDLNRHVEKIIKDGALPAGMFRVRSTTESMHHRADPYRRALAAGLLSVDLWTAARDDLYALLQGKKPDARARRLREALGELAARSGSIPSYFPTPYDLADRMVAEASIRPGQRVLEPEAGAGHIADLIRQRGVLPEVVERDPLLGEILTLKGFDLRATDFLKFRDPGYDRIVMNPPFEDHQDIQHVQHAYDLLAPGGRLVAIMSESAFIQNSSIAVGFRGWLKAHAGTSEELEPGSFRTSDVSTGVHVRLVVIDKE